MLLLWYVQCAHHKSVYVQCAQSDAEYVQCAHSVSRQVARSVCSLTLRLRAVCVLSKLCVFLSIIFRRKISTWTLDATYDVDGLRKISTWAVEAKRVSLLFVSFGSLECLAEGQRRDARTSAQAGAVMCERLAAVSEPLSCLWRLPAKDSSGRVPCSEDDTKTIIPHSHTHIRLQA
jgi:hypothetical protein